jgi:hypothetical protein
MTAINTLVGSTLADILAINTEVETLLASATEKRKAAVQPFLDALAASGEVSIIVIRGYTLGFNDGEPCTHSAESYMNVKSVLGDDVLESLEDGLEHRGAGFTGVRLLPIDLQFDAADADRGRPRLADQAIGSNIIGEVSERSKQLGTRVRHHAERNEGIVERRSP